MNLISLRDYCLKKKGATEDLPFDADTLAIRVVGKIFALMWEGENVSVVNLKCDPSLAQKLRRKYPWVKPGYHMNKQHWNTLEIDASVPAREVLPMIDHSYELVVKGLKKSDREWLENLHVIQ